MPKPDHQAVARELFVALSASAGKQPAPGCENNKYARAAHNLNRCDMFWQTYSNRPVWHFLTVREYLKGLENEKQD